MSVVGVNDGPHECVLLFGNFFLETDRAGKTICISSGISNGSMICLQSYKK